MMTGVATTLLLVVTLLVLATDAGKPINRHATCDMPKCEAGCFLDYSTRPCPSCNCRSGGMWSFRRPCKPVRCAPECRRVMDILGCLRCDSRCSPKSKLEKPKIICSLPKCPPGCEVQKIFEGPCPECDCGHKDNEEDIVGPNIQCSPPRCPPGCEIQEIFEGPCPGCDCGRNFRNKDSFKDVVEPPKVMCSVPKCRPGCDIQTVFDGPCPGCDCHEDVTPGVEYDCPEESLRPCPHNCEGIIDEDTGCKKCHCKKVCDEPKCSRFCKLKDGEDGCPACDCPRWGGWNKWRH